MTSNIIPLQTSTVTGGENQINEGSVSSRRQFYPLRIRPELVGNCVVNCADIITIDEGILSAWSSPCRICGPHQSIKGGQCRNLTGYLEINFASRFCIFTTKKWCRDSNQRGNRDRRPCGPAPPGPAAAVNLKPALNFDVTCPVTE